VAQRMLDFLAATAREARRQAGLRQIDIATTAGVAHTIISAFELAEHWPQRIDEIIAAYAQELGCDPTDLWGAAVQRWRTGQ
jgi:transcriptional regulator with XRE-family HTH domain